MDKPRKWGIYSNGKTNPVGKIINFFKNEKFNPRRIVSQHC